MTKESIRLALADLDIESPGDIEDMSHLIDTIHDIASDAYDQGDCDGYDRGNQDGYESGFQDCLTEHSLT